MKVYWDSSALIEILEKPELRAALKSTKDFTRLHSLSEIFSTLTKGVNFRYSPDDAAKMVSDLAEDLKLLEMTKADVLEALKSAKKLGVRGARIHDLMHATAARKCGAEALMTLDMAGFTGLDIEMEIVAP